MTRLHATCIAIGGRGVLLIGPSGAGKSDLALRLIDRGAQLVADDGVELRAVDGRLEACAPATIAGLVEIRGIGVVSEVAAPSAFVALALILRADPERMPPDPLPSRTIEDISVPELALAPFEASAPIKAERALVAFGLPG